MVSVVSAHLDWGAIRLCWASVSIALVSLLFSSSQEGRACNDGVWFGSLNAVRDYLDRVDFPDVCLHQANCIGRIVKNVLKNE